MGSEEAVHKAIAQLEAGAEELGLTANKVGDTGAAALATVFATNTALKELTLCQNDT